MKFLPYSNGVRTVNMKRQRSPKEKFKIISRYNCRINNYWGFLFKM